MRLGQLARKYDVSAQEIIVYLNDLNTTETFHANAKLDKETETLVAEQFGILDEYQEDHEKVIDELPEEEPQEPLIPEKEPIEEEPPLTEEIATPVLQQPEPATASEEIAMVGGDLEDVTIKDESIQKESKIAEETPVAEKENRKEDEVIETDRLMEIMESEDAPVDLDKITLIKAPKKELEGLKVLGKIELEEQEKEPKEESEPKEKVRKLDDEEIARRVKEREEQKERKRLAAKKKQEECEARREKQRIEKEEREKKAIKEAHYKQKLSQTKAHKQPKPKSVDQPPVFETENETKQPKPKTLLGSFWRWLNP
jgi:hypothetical protein